MRLQNVKGFTLIELLVVITIIGILAVGGIGVYNSQIEKARDAVRIQDMQKVSAAAEQYYQDDQGYPKTASVVNDIKTYMQKIPKDPKSGQARGTGATATVFDYVYKSQARNGINEQDYEFSTALENDGNMKNKAAESGDAGKDPNRLEVGNNTAAVVTKCAKLVSGKCSGLSIVK